MNEVESVRWTIIVSRETDLALRRLKKRKLMLKDWIAKLESLLIPDAPA